MSRSGSAVGRLWVVGTVAWKERPGRRGSRGTAKSLKNLEAGGVQRFHVADRQKPFLQTVSKEAIRTRTV